MRSWICIFLVMACAGSGLAESETNGLSALFDAEDGQLDFSTFLGSASGFMPVPIMITEPAVGVGAGVALLFFHDAPEKKESVANVAGGGGFRYLLAKAYNMRAGVDIARGPEDTAIYLVIGGRWR